MRKVGLLLSETWGFWGKEVAEVTPTGSKEHGDRWKNPSFFKYMSPRF